MQPSEAKQQLIERRGWGPGGGWLARSPRRRQLLPLKLSTFQERRIKSELLDVCARFRGATSVFCMNKACSTTYFFLSYLGLHLIKHRSLPPHV